MAEPFRFTTGRWFNRPREDGDYAKAPAYREGFTYEGFAYGSDTPEHYPVPGDAPGGLQVSLVCSRSAQFLAIDVDYPENLAGSATGEHVSWGDALSTRGSHFHAGVDMRGAPPELWPVQGRTAWGDVKAAGFIPVPGSVHKSGARYEAVPGWEGKLLGWTPELLAALRKDRDDHALRRLAEARTRLGLSAATRLPDGSYLYASGYAGGTWQELGDGSLAHDDELKDLVWDMHVEYGRPEAEVREQWERLACALGSPWTERDFTRHWHRVPARRAEKLESDDATRLEEDFGLRMLSPALQVLHSRQVADWEQRAKEAEQEGRPAPTPVPEDGPFEDPYDRVSSDDRFEHRLRVGSYAQWFDAGAPSDSGNARAVLARLEGVAAYDIDRGAWLKRVSARWDDAELGSNLRPVLVALEEVLPEGCAEPLKHPRYEHLDPDADGAEIAALKRHAKNRDRFASTSGRQSVATAVSDTAVRYAGRVSVRAAELDREPEILWAGGIPWDLRRSVTVPVRSALDRGRPHLMTAAVQPDPSVPTPLWDAFCAALFPDERGRSWALQVMAVCFTGYSDAVMPILMGDPGRGKTHFVKRLIDVLGGTDAWSYGGVMNADLLRSDARLHGTFTLDLKGKRLAFIDEAPGHGVAAQRRLKSLTGGGDLQGNRMRENPVTFAPTHTLVMTANHEDPPPLDEPALQRRARLVFFEGDPAAIDAASHAIDGGEPQRAAWRAELPGVLAQMMSLAGRWLADKHVADSDQAPDAWRFKAADEVTTQDPVLAWLDCGEIVPDEGGTRSSALRENFISWCKRQGKAAPTETKWGRRLTELGYPVSGRDAGGKYRPLKIVLPGASDWLHGSGPARSTVQPTVHEGFPSSDSPSVYSLYSLYSSNNSTHKENVNTPPTDTHPYANNGEPTVHYAQTPSEIPSDLGNVSFVHGSLTVHNPPPALSTVHGEGEPAGLKKDNRLENGEKRPEAKIADSPPEAKNPRSSRAPGPARARLTDEEKLERAQARKARLAEERVAAKAAKVAELGGPLVTLPAVVLRDLSILELSPAQAAAWLSGMTALSVDVEHSGFPVGHPDHRLRLVQLGDEHSAVVLDPSDPAQAEVVREALRAAQGLHAHSAHADLIPLEAAGLCDGSAWDKMTDTVILAKLSDPALCGSEEHGLKALARAMLGDDYALSWSAEKLKNDVFAAGGWLIECEVTTPAERSGWAMIPVCEAFVRYAASDVFDCAAIARALG